MSTRPGRILAITVAALLLLAVVGAVLSTTRGNDLLPDGSPEATVQAYLEAVYAEDYGRAATYLDPEGGRSSRQFADVWVDPASRVVLRGTRHPGGADRALVDVEVVHGDGGPFGQDGWTEEQTFVLVHGPDGWRLTEVPWPLQICEEGGR
ncbi:hypothetical protein [Ornithinimicrobium panacihumi]|uniref:hypothetical protein n=1 Tax=Ornithinimicrobium panacihumi TaxID=2008449 RepID=UPI003F8A916A